VELDRRPPERISRAALVLGLYGALALLAVGIGAVRGNLNIVQLPGSTPERFLLGPLLGIAVGLLVVFLTRLTVHRFDWARRLHRSFRGLLGSLGARDVLVLGLASSIGEELFFRGAMLPWLGLWGSALVFALLHIGPGVRYLPWTLSAFIMGVVLGEMFIVLGDLSGPVVAHFTINYLNLGYITRVDLPGD